MNPRQKRRYLLAVYLLIVLTAVVLMALGFNPQTDSWKAVILSLSTELIGVALVFFLVDFLFSVDEWNLSDRVKELMALLQQERPEATKFFQPLPGFEEYIARGEQIDMCGVTMTSTFNRAFSSLRQRLFEGANIRLLIINPDYVTLQMAARRSEDKDNVDYYKRRLEAVFNDIEYMYKSIQEKMAHGGSGLGTFSVRLLSYAPSFGIVSFDVNKPHGAAFVEIYPHHAGYGNSPKFMLTDRRDGEWYHYFTQQFEEMWAAAKTWQPGMWVEDADKEWPLNKPVTISSFFHPQQLDQNLNEAQTIYIAGITLTRTLRDYYHVLRSRYLAGATIRIILLDPHGDVTLAELASLWTLPRDTDAAYWRSRLESSIKMITGGMMVNHREGQGNGRLELGYLPFIPPFGLIIADPQTEQGKCSVEVYHWNEDASELTFALDKAHDGYWFGFFCDQFEQLWQACRVENWEHGLSAPTSSKTG